MTKREGKRKTHATFLVEFNEIYKGEYELVSEYIKAHERVLIRHLKCGNTYKIFPTSVLRGSKCNFCAKTEGRKRPSKSHDDFEKQVKMIHGNEFELISKYSSSNETVLVKHLVCGGTSNMFPTSILSGSGCAACARRESGKKKRRTHESFEHEIDKLYGSEYELVSEYETYNKDISIRHKSCDLITTMKAMSLLRGNHKCRECYGMSHRKKHEDFIKEVYECVGDEYSILSEYVKNSLKVKIKHVLCGHEYETTPATFLKGSRCPECSMRDLSKRPEVFAEEVKQLVGEDYTILTDYQKYGVKVNMRHNICGHVYEILPEYFRDGSRCPNCRNSRGEFVIKEVLNKYHISFVKEKRFDGCRRTITLPFDFLIENSLLVEFDGKGHFYPVDFGGKGERFALEQLIYRKENDEIKNKYCIKEGIGLLRIPFVQYKNIESILISFLLYYGVLDKMPEGVKIIDISEYVVDKNWNQKEYIKKHTMKELALGEV